MLNIFQDIARQRRIEAKSKLKRDFIHLEAKIGGRMFGVTQKNVRREFFCLDPHTWVWHEEWTDNYGKRQIVTTRYNLRPEGIIKAHNNQHYEKVGKDEAKNFILAASLYLKRVRAEVY